MVINFHYVLNLNCHLCMPKSIIKRMGQLQSVKYIYIFLFNYYIYLSYTFFILLIYYYYISCLSMTPWTQHCYRVTSSPFLSFFYHWANIITSFLFISKTDKSIVYALRKFSNSILVGLFETLSSQIREYYVYRVPIFFF